MYKKHESVYAFGFIWIAKDICWWSCWTLRFTSSDYGVRQAQCGVFDLRDFLPKICGANADIEYVDDAVMVKVRVCQVVRTADCG